MLGGRIFFYSSIALASAPIHIFLEFYDQQYAQYTYYYQVNCCFPTYPSSKQWTAVSGMNLVGMVINP